MKGRFNHTSFKYMRSPRCAVKHFCEYYMITNDISACRHGLCEAHNGDRRVFPQLHKGRRTVETFYSSLASTFNTVILFYGERLFSGVRISFCLGRYKTCIFITS